MLTYGSAFSGVGGMDRGFEAAGFRCRWQIELDQRCQEILRRHWPDVSYYGDIRQCGADNLASVDVLIGGWPCQDHSVAGKRRGFDGERSSLFWEFARIAAELRPRWIVAENVPGLLSQRDEFRSVIRTLDHLGYLGAWRVLNAEFFGVPQRRNRVYLVAGLGSAGERAPEVLFESARSGRHPATRRTTGQVVAATLGTGASSAGGHRQDLDGAGAYVVGIDRFNQAISTGAMFTLDTLGEHADGVFAPDIASTLSAHDAKHLRSDGGSDNLVVAATVQASAGHHGHSSPRGDGTDNLIVSAAAFDPINITSKANRSRVEAGLPSPSLHTGGMSVAVGFDWQTAGSARSRPAYLPELSPTVQANQTPAIAFTERTRADGRNFESQTELAYALTNPGSGGRTHSRQIAQDMTVRRLMPVECERLQGWPDNWTDGQPDSTRYRQIGNGVATPVAEWIAHRLLAVMEGAA